MNEYSNSYLETSGRLWQFKRYDPPTNDNGILVNVALNNSVSFKYKSSILGKPAAVGRNEY